MGLPELRDVDRHLERLGEQLIEAVRDGEPVDEAVAAMAAKMPLEDRLRRARQQGLEVLGVLDRRVRRVRVRLLGLGRLRPTVGVRALKTAQLAVDDEAEDKDDPLPLAQRRARSVRARRAVVALLDVLVDDTPSPQNGVMPEVLSSVLEVLSSVLVVVLVPGVL